MANLIIKPTSGGSLVLQDEGGDTAVTVGTTGDVTFGTGSNGKLFHSIQVFTASGTWTQVVDTFTADAERAAISMVRGPSTDGGRLDWVL